VVSDGVAGLAAESVDVDGAVGLAGGGIEGYVSLLDVEGSVNDVEGVGQGEMDFAASGVEGELVLWLFLRVQDCWEESGGDEQERLLGLVFPGSEARGTKKAVKHAWEKTPSMRVRRG